MTQRKGVVAAKFWARVDKSGECWLWTGWLDSDGYGRYSTGWKHAHRVAWALAGHDPVPELDHICNVRRCVNPGHLRPTDRRTNTLRGTSPAALNAVKTHCRNGHPYDAANTYWRTNGGGRDCRACHSARTRRRYAAAKDAA